MAEIVNLRMARKRNARAEKERTASENRAVHGLSKAERQGLKADGDRAKLSLDRHRLERPSGDKA
jgi:hypothetical protein